MPTLAELHSRLFPEIPETQAQKAELFYLALGRFVCTYASAEVSVYILLFHLLKITSWKARALIGGQNMRSLVALTKRIAPKCFGPMKLKELNALLAQLEVITQFRHDLVHRGADISVKEIKSTNFFSAKTFDAIDEMILEIDHVASATSDLQRISLRIYYLALPKMVGKLTKEPRKLLFAPWQYKSLARQNVAKQLLLESQKRERPPQPSHP